MENERFYTARWELVNDVPITKGSAEALLLLLDKQLGPRQESTAAPIQEAPAPILDEPTQAPLPDGLLDYDIDEDGDVDRDDFASSYNAQRTWCPWAEDIPKQRSKGTYQTKNGLPYGAVVHFDAGHPDATLSRMGAIAQETGYGYWCIDGEGRVGQANPLNKWSSHAGKSYHPKLGRSVSRFLVGIEVACPGKLKHVGNGKAKSWFPRLFDLDDCRTVKAEANRKAGLYYAYTEQQEEALLQALMWMKWNDPDNFSFDLVVGHDEVSPDRKNDPGGSLNSIMPALRQRLKDDWAELQKRLGV